jgi:hypothetical protein
MRQRCCIALNLNVLNCIAVKPVETTKERMEALINKYTSDIKGASTRFEVLL